MKQFKIYFSNQGYEDVAFYTAPSADVAINEFREEFPISCTIDGITEQTGETV